MNAEQALWEEEEAPAGQGGVYLDSRTPEGSAEGSAFKASLNYNAEAILD